MKGKKAYKCPKCEKEFIEIEISGEVHCLSCVLEMLTESTRDLTRKIDKYYQRVLNNELI